METIYTHITELLLTLLVMLLTWASAVVRARMAASDHREDIKVLGSELIDAVADGLVAGVIRLKTELLEALSDGKLSDAEIETLLDLALAETKKSLGPNMLARVAKAYELKTDHQLDEFLLGSLKGRLPIAYDLLEKLVVFEGVGPGLGQLPPGSDQATKA